MGKGMANGMLKASVKKKKANIKAKRKPVIRSMVTKNLLSNV